MGLQCLISGISNGILGDIIKDVLTSNNSDVFEVDSINDDLFHELSPEINYLFVGMNNKTLPEEYKNVFSANNDLIVVEILNDGKSLGLYIDDINALVLNQIINIHDYQD